jgi:hypothetical protein
MVGVPLDLRVEEVDGGGLGPQELVRVIEVVPGLRDRPLSVVIELAVLVPADDVPGLEGLDLLDRVPPRSRRGFARGTCARRCRSRLPVHAVVDHVSRDNECEIRDVEDGRVVAVGVADLDDHEFVSLEREALSGTVTAVTGVGGIPAYTLSQSSGRMATLLCICAIVPAEATTRAPNRSASSPAVNQWSPSPWV